MQEVRAPEYGDSSTSIDDRLFFVLAEQLKLPLIQIARQAELARSLHLDDEHFRTIELTADTTLNLLDSYLLSIKLAQDNVLLEPVSIGAVMYDVAHKLDGLAKQHQFGLELHFNSRYEPVMAHKRGLESALISIGSVFIESQSPDISDKFRVLKLAAHRSNSGIVAGVFSDVEGLTAAMYKHAKDLFGFARQPLTQMTAASGAGVFVAESLMQTMAAKLRVARHQKTPGLAATFLPSKQLALV